MEPFVKARPDAPHGYFACEAAGLRWLTVPGGPRVVHVRVVAPGSLTLDRLTEVPPTADAARDFGRRLATLHDAGAPAWGALPPGVDAGFFGPLDEPLPMPGGAWGTWARFYGEARLLPMLDLGRRRGVFDGSDAAAFAAVVARLDDLAGPAADDVPARLHGDLWSENVLWVRRPHDDAVEAVLIDPAAHGGHREADLAMLALFGTSFLDEIVAGYGEAHPLARGWQHRVTLHQLFPVAAHAVLFGGGFVGQTRRILGALAAGS
ncbi:fructosamine kinase family protein [Xylanimonas protaetiae]|uniref:Fructosamine kinase n=1 Tax=Xylanimonas protaetiae TaxID=2509457 RepID=A0A4P6F6T9_9MICO|nr:fructosamine kinase family protein [Xylanimonas protaetiae]QAY71374.1 fructosamine kinase [Xylanimonas protaetiae]